ncbi:MAG: HAD-IIIA family hydrolase [Fusobacteria bacterium]|nr:HAD-IIIA family hydrolase [Fusobacteriota bacterium]
MIERAKKIKWLLLDVDGTLTDGKICMDNNGIETKNFNVKDGFAIANAIKYGLNIGIVTGRNSEIVKRRAEELKIHEIYQNVKDKTKILNEIENKYNLDRSEICYIGDDINDLGIMKQVGFAASPNDCVTEIKKISHMISSKNGGEGAVREIIEFILNSQGIWDKIIKSYN